MEEETIFRMRARLFIMKDGTWQLRGVGNAKLLRHKSTQRTRLVMLKHMSTQAIANQFVQPEAVLLSTSSEGDDRNRAFVFEADDYATGKIEHHTFAIRFKTEDDASAFYTAYCEAQVHNAIIAGGGVPAAGGAPAAGASGGAGLGAGLMSPGAASDAGSRVGGLASPAAPPQPPVAPAPAAAVVPRAADTAAIPPSAAASAAPSVVPSVASTPLRQPPVSSAAAVAAALASAAPAPAAVAAASARPAAVETAVAAAAPAPAKPAVETQPAAAAAVEAPAAPAVPTPASTGKSWVATVTLAAIVAGGAFFVASQARPTLAAEVKDAVAKGLEKVKAALK